MMKSHKKLEIQMPQFVALSPRLFEPFKDKWGREKYLLTAQFDPKTDLSPVREAIKVLTQDWENPLDFEHPLRLQDKRWFDHFGEENAYYCKCQSDYKPEVIDQNGHPIFNADEFPEGMLADAIVKLLRYEQHGMRGILVLLDCVRRRQDPSDVDREYGTSMSAAERFAMFDAKKKKEQ